VLTAVIVVVALGMVALSTLAIVNLVDARQALLDEIDPASLSVGQLLLAYVDQETGVRGYILSRNPSFLQPTVSGLVEQKKASGLLAADLHDRPDLLSLVHTAQREALRWQKTWVQPAIKDTAAGNLSFASPEAQAYGKMLLDRARSDFSRLDAALAVARTSDGSALQTTTQQLIVVVGVGVLLLVGIPVALRAYLRRWVLDPLEAVAADTRRVRLGEHSQPITTPEPEEIRELAVDVEAMRHRIEVELEQVDAARASLSDLNEALQRSNAELEQFAYVASHDLQEPLRKVTSFVQRRQQRYPGQLDERADQYIEFTVDGASRMQQLISDLLAFSRVARTTDRFETLPLRVCVDEAVDNLHQALAESGGTVEVADPLPSVRGDRALLVSLWQNLIANSLKFHSTSPPEVRIDVLRVGHEWLFRTTDNGIGVEPRFAEKVFVIFQRLHGRDRYPGTGIGLALCQKIVNFHGGRMWLDTSYQGGGARFCFTLPVVDPVVGEGN